MERCSADRGRPWQFDPGPRPGGRFADLFAQVPDYRAVGLRFERREMFHWQFGPVFYRGRLEGGRSRVLVIGRDGSSDDALSHRAFTGGGGARLQHLLCHVGITQSYLFMPSLYFPLLRGDMPSLRGLVQHPESPLVVHRHAVLDQVIAENPISLVIGVGPVAREAVATWIRAHGGRAHPDRLHEAASSRIAGGLRAVGVLDPADASSSGSASRVADSFRRAVGLVDTWLRADAGWLPADAERPPVSAFRYERAPIPFGDLAYGTAWRIGHGATTSNRRDGQRSIQLFSADGRYNNVGQAIGYEPVRPGPVDDDHHAPVGAEVPDLAFEPGGAVAARFDPGPSERFAALLQGGEAGTGWPDFEAAGLPGHPSFGHGPVYRGQLDNPVVLVLADPSGHDDLFLGRAQTGDAGQHLQGLLAAIGVGDRYAILATLPVDTAGASASTVSATVAHPAVRAILTEVVRRAAPAVLLSIGPHARCAVAALPGETPTIGLAAFGAPGWLRQWRAASATLVTMDLLRARPGRTWDGRPLPVARADLPFGVPGWQGDHGDRAVRAVSGGVPSRDYFKIVVPAPVASRPPRPLSVEDRRDVDAVKT